MSDKIYATYPRWAVDYSDIWERSQHGKKVLTNGEVRDRLNALEAERDRYAKALETIELMDPDWTLGVDENMGRLQSIAGRALKGGGDE